MPRGFTGVRSASDDINARRNAGGGGDGRLWFALKDGESAVVRFLEEGDEVNFAWKHKLPPSGKRAFNTFIVCRDQDENGEKYGEECPGCDRDIKREFRGAINLIWRDGPIYERDEKGKLVKDRYGDKIVKETGDQIAVWDTGIMVFEELNGLDIAYKGLKSRDFRITRKGTEFNTRYNIFPADPDGGPQPLSKSDEELAATKYDLEAEMVPPSVNSYWDDNWVKKDGVSSVADIPAGSPFRRKALTNA